MQSSSSNAMQNITIDIDDCGIVGYSKGSKGYRVRVSLGRRINRKRCNYDKPTCLLSLLSFCSIVSYASPANFEFTRYSSYRISKVQNSKDRFWLCYTLCREFYSWHYSISRWKKFTDIFVPSYHLIFLTTDTA